jgi:hypothetical protein
LLRGYVRTRWNPGAEGRAPRTDTLAFWLAARYAVATRRIAQTGGREGWRLLREMCGDIVDLRKGDHSAERLQIERERLELEKKKARQRISGDGLSAQERARRMRENFRAATGGKKNRGLTDETLTEI